MKAPALLLLSLPLVAISAPPSFLPNFEHRLDNLPNLSMGETIKQGTLPTWVPGAREVTARPEPLVTPRRPRYVSKMPVLEPNSSVDPHMPIKTPTPGVDYKLMIKEPDIASAR